MSTNHMLSDSDLVKFKETCTQLISTTDDKKRIKEALISDPLFGPYLNAYLSKPGGVRSYDSRTNEEKQGHRLLSIYGSLYGLMRSRQKKSKRLVAQPKLLPTQPDSIMGIYRELCHTGFVPNDKALKICLKSDKYVSGFSAIRNILAKDGYQFTENEFGFVCTYNKMISELKTIKDEIERLTARANEIIKQSEL